MNWSWRCAELPTMVDGSDRVSSHLWGYMKDMAYVATVNTRYKLLRYIICTARTRKYTARLKFPISLATRVLEFIQGDADPFEQRATEVNYVTITVL